MRKGVLRLPFFLGAVRLEFFRFQRFLRDNKNCREREYKGYLKKW